MNVAGHWTFSGGAVVVVVGVSLEGPRRGMIDAGGWSEGLCRVLTGRAMRTAGNKNVRAVQIGVIRKTPEQAGLIWRV